MTRFNTTGTMCICHRERHTFFRTLLQVIFCGSILHAGKYSASFLLDFNFFVLLVSSKVEDWASIFETELSQFYFKFDTISSGRILNGPNETVCKCKKAGKTPRGDINPVYHNYGVTSLLCRYVDKQFPQLCIFSTLKVRCAELHVISLHISIQSSEKLPRS